MSERPKWWPISWRTVIRIWRLSSSRVTWPWSSAALAKTPSRNSSRVRSPPTYTPLFVKCQKPQNGHSYVRNTGQGPLASRCIMRLAASCAAISDRRFFFDRHILATMFSRGIVSEFIGYPSIIPIRLFLSMMFINSAMHRSTSPCAMSPFSANRGKKSM